LWAVTVTPLDVAVAFQAWVSCSPLVNVQVTVHPRIAADPAVTVTALWKPPDQELTTLAAALQAPAGGTVVGAVVGGVVGTVVGGVVGVVVGGVVGSALPPLVVYVAAVYGWEQVEPQAVGSAKL
jgi:hypothetical protein